MNKPSAVLGASAHHLLRHSVWLKSFLYRCYWSLPERWRPDPTGLRTILRRLAVEQADVYFLNIGANDGLAGDPLREFVIRHCWHGLLMEPVDYVFRRLECAYRNLSGVVCERAALADRDGVLMFWHLRKNSELPPGYDQIGSFNQEHVLKHNDMFPGLEKYLTYQTVPGLTLASLLKKHRIARVDVLLIDTEGYDHRVLAQVDFRCLQPKVIVFETTHLNSADKAACCERLRAEGYALRESHGNAIATRGISPARNATS